MTGRLGAARQAKNSSGTASAFSKGGLIRWRGTIVLVGMMTSACAASELRTLAAGGPRLASGVIQPVVPEGDTMQPTVFEDVATESTVPEEGPTVLADLELDSITAAGVVVDVNSFAAALGDFGRTATDADTFTLSRDAYELGLGFTMGSALACCGDGADVEVGSIALGIGDYVRGTTHAFEDDGDGRRRWAHGYSLGFVLALSFRQHWVIDHEARQAIVGELQATYTDLHNHLQAAALDFHLANVR